MANLKRRATTTRKPIDWRREPLKADVRCRLCKEPGTIADIHPYCFPDSKDPIWLHRVGCSTDYHQKWREWHAKNS